MWLLSRLIDITVTKRWGHVEGTAFLLTSRISNNYFRLHKVFVTLILAFSKMHWLVFIQRHAMVNDISIGLTIITVLWWKYSVMETNRGTIVQRVTSDSIFMRLFIFLSNICKFMQVNILRKGSGTFKIFTGLLIGPAFPMIDKNWTLFQLLNLWVKLVEMCFCR